VWSPDGKQVLFASSVVPKDPASGAIFIADADGSNAHALTDPSKGVVASDGGWSPDGKQVAFSGQTKSGNHSIYLINVDGTGAQKLGTSGRPSDSQPSWGSIPGDLVLPKPTLTHTPKP